MHASPSFRSALFFADDTTIVSTHDYLDILLDKTNEELNKLVDWFDAKNLLSKITVIKLMLCTSIDQIMILLMS